MGEKQQHRQYGQLTQRSKSPESPSASFPRGRDPHPKAHTYLSYFPNAPGLFVQ